MRKGGGNPLPLPVERVVPGAGLVGVGNPRWSESFCISERRVGTELRHSGKMLIPYKT